jgi:tetratricopeptide (TPR) repeat protein
MREMKYFLLVAAAGCIFIACLAGCRNAEEKKITSIPPVVDHTPKPESAQTPYYYGLIEEYRTVVAEDPHNLAALIGLGNAYAESGSWREAINYYESALKIDPHNADVHTDLGTAYRNLGMPYRALEEYQRALRHEPGHLDARYHMGILYAFDFRDYAVAIHTWEELMQLSPNYPQSTYMRNCIVTFRKMLRKGHD